MDKLITLYGFMKGCALLIMILTFASSTFATSYIRYHYGYHAAQQGYLEDSADNQNVIQYVDVSFLSWRRERTGLLARGPRLQWQQAQHFNQLGLTLPLYQWTADHGAFFEYQHSRWQLETDWSQNQIYLQEAGTALSTGTGSSTFENEQTYWHFYWHEGVNHEGPINRVGISYVQVHTPASADISGLNASIYDASFSGWGIQLGRIKQDRGLNFQWLLNIHNLQTDFSNDVTQHRSNAMSEGEDLRFHVEMDWHYRYRIEPYWYWVPKIGTQLMYQTQSATDPQVLKHDAYTTIDWYVSLGLQIAF